MSDRSRYLTPPVAPDAGAASGVEMGRVDLFVTNHCNQACVFCYLKAPQIDEVPPEFRLDAISEVLREGHDRGYLEVDISGGEPTVCRSLEAVIAQARDLGYRKIKMMTNGVRLADPFYAKSLVDAGLTHVALSVHGASAALYSAVHGRDDFKRSLQAAVHLRRLAPRVSVELNTVVTRDNVDALSSLGRWVELVGLERLHVQLLVPNSAESAAHFPGHARASAAFQRFMDHYGGRLKINFAFVPPCLMGKHAAAVPDFDFTAAFFTNRPDFLLSWQRSLLAAKRTVAACAGCAHWKGCRGHWLPRGAA